MTLQNWMSDWDLICSSSSFRGMFMMMFFTGYAVANFFVPYLGDRFGRRKVFLCALFTQIGTLVGMVLLPKHNSNMPYVLMTLYFINGVESTAKNMLGYCYFNEFLPERH